MAVVLADEVTAVEGATLKLDVMVVALAAEVIVLTVVI